MFQEKYYFSYRNMFKLALVKMIMRFGLSFKWGIMCYLSEWLLVSQDGLYLTGWCRSSTLKSDSRGAEFESMSIYRLFWLRFCMVFITLSRDSTWTMTVSCQIIIHLSSSHPMTCSLDTEKTSSNNQQKERRFMLNGSWSLVGPSISVNIILFICLSLCSVLLDLGRFCSFFILYRVGMTLWTVDQPIESPLPTHRIT